jgi:hypothetical protein
MDRKEFRQIDERYLAGKFMEGASLDEIAKDAYNPVEEMKYVSGQGNESGGKPGVAGTSSFSAAVWFVIIGGFLVLGLLGALLKAIP